MPFDFAAALIFLSLAGLFLAATLAVGRLLRPSVPNPRKAMVYECGETPLGGSWFNFNPRFYLVALVFLVFDVEVAVTFPVAAVFRRWVAAGRGALALAELAAFVAVLLLGLAYVRRKGDLAWPVSASEVANEASPGGTRVPPPATAASLGAGRVARP